jgi:hypothetical protein
MIIFRTVALGLKKFYVPLEWNLLVDDNRPCVTVGERNLKELAGSPAAKLQTVKRQLKRLNYSASG